MSERIAELLKYALGKGEKKESYTVFYHLTPEGGIEIERCERKEGSVDTLIRFMDYSGRVEERKVTKEELEAAIDEYVSNNKRNGR